MLRRWLRIGEKGCFLCSYVGKIKKLGYMDLGVKYGGARISLVLGFVVLRFRYGGFVVFIL